MELTTTKAATNGSIANRLAREARHHRRHFPVAGGLYRCPFCGKPAEAVVSDFAGLHNEHYQTVTGFYCSHCNEDEPEDRTAAEIEVLDFQMARELHWGNVTHASDIASELASIASSLGEPDPFIQSAGESA